MTEWMNELVYLKKQNLTALLYNVTKTHTKNELIPKNCSLRQKIIIFMYYKEFR